VDALVDPVEADHDDDESAEVVDVVAVDFDAVDLVVPLAAVVVVLMVAVPAAMHAPSVAVASRLATPAATRERAAGRRRRGRAGIGCIWSSLMSDSLRARRQRGLKPT
jgi:hypothetical protein